MFHLHRQYLSEEERQRIDVRLHYGGAYVSKDGKPAFVAWPRFAPKQYNGCTDPCDMWDGPCACGGWHRAGR